MTAAPRRVCCAGLAVAVAFVALCGPGASAPAQAGGGWYLSDPDDVPYREPPSLPEGIGGGVRSSQPPPRRDAGAGRVERIRDVFLAIRTCWRPLGASAGPTGQEVTIRLSFKRSGEVLGVPRITYYNPGRAGGDRDAREAFTRSIAAAFQACTPLRFSPAFAAAIAGRPFTFRFMDDRAI